MDFFKELFAFLDELKANNNREWFAANKERYERIRAQWIEQLQKLINKMAEKEPALRYVEAKDCLYRIYRDTRFSPDKTPYKTYFSALISPQGRHCTRACHYVHVGADECAIYSGLWCPESKVLKKLRKAVVDNLDEFRGIVETDEIKKVFPGWYGRQLKTAPQGYDRSHPAIEYLRLTEFGKAHYMKRSEFKTDKWQQSVADKLALLIPMNDFLNYSIDE